MRLICWIMGHAWSVNLLYDCWACRRCHMSSEQVIAEGFILKRLLRWWRIEPMENAHYATMYGVPCWFADVPPDGCALAGRNQLYDLLLLIIPHLHNYMVAPFYDCGFPIKVGPRADGASEPEC